MKRYFSGKVLSIICVPCRKLHPFLRELNMQEHEYKSDVPIHCQLCGRDIVSGKLPSDPNGEPSGF